MSVVVLLLLVRLARGLAPVRWVGPLASGQTPEPSAGPVAATSGLLLALPEGLEAVGLCAGGRLSLLCLRRLASAAAPFKGSAAAASGAPKRLSAAPGREGTSAPSSRLLGK